MELAKLAALLPQNANASPARTLEVAMEFYVEAVILCRQNADMSLDDLTAKFRSRKRLQELRTDRIKEADQARWRDTLELDPEKDTDQARAYLAEQGLSIKTGRTVLDHIREAWNARPADMISGSFDVLANCRRSLDGKTVYWIPRFLLEAVARMKKSHRKKIKQKSRINRAPKNSAS